MDPQSILVGVDFSPASRVALRAGADLARRAGAELHVLHVLGAEALEQMAHEESSLGTPLHDRVGEEARRALQAEVEAARLAGRCRQHVVVGVPLLELLAHERSTHSDLLVLGAGGHGPGVVGSLAHRLLQASPVPVWLVPEAQHVPPRTVAAAVDFSEASGLALERAARCARLFDARLRVLHVYEGPWFRLDVRSDLLLPHEATARAIEVRRARLERAVAQVADLTQGLEVRAEVVEHPSAAHGLAEQVRAREVDLLVLGTRGRNALRHALLGSVAQRLATLLPCGLLAVGPGG